MAEDQLIYLIKKELLEGLDKKSISDKLASNGWKLEDIEKAFKEIEISNQNYSVVITNRGGRMFSEVKLKKPKSKIIIKILIILFILAVGILGYFYRNHW